MQSRAAARRIPAALLAGIMAMLAAPPGTAGDGPWVRYENGHFVAYSNAPEKKVLPLLTDLEAFRAAFVQVGNIRVPAASPKTMVLIPASMQEFRELATSKLQAGFATHDGERTLIVMPGQGGKSWTRTVIRHEFAHALLRYKQFDYPAWYEEGFAELVSSTELVKDGKAFTLGSAPERAENNGPPVFGWDILVSDEFNPHALTDRRQGSSAYAQAWLLAHYATLGNGLKNASRLQAYFDRLKAGEASTAAFEAAFEVSVDDLWESTLRPYAHRIPYYTFPFEAGYMDPVFATSVPGSGEVDGLIHYLELRSAWAGGPSVPPTAVPASLTGRWAPFHIGSTCSDYADIELRPATGTVAISSAAESGASVLEAGTYPYELVAGGVFRLTLPRENARGGGELYVRNPKADMLCVGADAEPGPECQNVMYRCR